MERYHSLVERFENQQFYQNLFYEAHDPHFILNTAYEITNVNSVFIKLFNLLKGIWNEMPVSKLFIKEGDYEVFVGKLEKEGDGNELETVLKANKGKLQCLIRWSVFYSSDGTVSSYHGIIQDQTEKKKKQREHQLADKYAMTGRISRMIAHEVRNPLTNIKLAMSQISANIQEDPMLTTYGDIINRNADRINALITSLLNASIPAEVHLGPLKVDGFIDTAVEGVKDRALLKGIQIEKLLDQNLPIIQADENRLVIAMTNLLVNATEAIQHEDGKIEVRAFVAKDNGKTRITITDNGDGMPIEVQNKLFEPFFSKKKSGTGLGLSTTLNIVKAHGGQLSCTSEVGKGTTFYIDL